MIKEKNNEVSNNPNQQAMQIAMQELASHFNRKKSQFVGFFSSIIQVIQKLAYDIQMQIDKEYYASANELKNFNASAIQNALQNMEQNRVQLYHEMVDRLYGTLKVFVNNIGASHKQQIHQNDSRPRQVQIQEVQIPKKFSSHNFVQSQQENLLKIPINQPLSSNPSSDAIKLVQSRESSRELEPKSPFNFDSASNNSHKINQQPIKVQMPSPFAQKIRQNKMKESALIEQPESSTQRTKQQKIQIMKKTDVCESLDNYLNKEAKQMLQRNLSRQNSHSSLRKSQTKRYDTPERTHYHNKHDSSSHLDKRLQEKLGNFAESSSGKYQSVGMNIFGQNSSKKISQNMISPIQRYKF